MAGLRSSAMNVEKINHALVMLDRERSGREASSTGALLIAKASKRPKPVGA
jgi:hypothetical protein